MPTIPTKVQFVCKIVNKG